MCWRCWERISEPLIAVVEKSLAEEREAPVCEVGKVLQEVTGGVKR